MSIGLGNFQNLVSNNANLDSKYFVKDGDNLALHEKSGFFSKSVIKADKNNENYGLRQQFLNAMGTNFTTERNTVEKQWLTQLKGGLGLENNANNAPKVLSARLVYDNIKALDKYKLWKGAFASLKSDYHYENEMYEKGFEDFLKEKTGGEKFDFSRIPECNENNLQEFKAYLDDFATKKILPECGLPTLEDLESELGINDNTKKLSPRQKGQLEQLKQDVLNLQDRLKNAVGKLDDVRRDVGEVLSKYADLFLERFLTGVNYSIEEKFSQKLSQSKTFKDKTEEEKIECLGELKQRFVDRLKEGFIEEIKKNPQARRSILSPANLYSGIVTMSKEFVKKGLSEEKESLDSQKNEGVVEHAPGNNDEYVPLLDVIKEEEENNIEEEENNIEEEENNIEEEENNIEEEIEEEILPNHDPSVKKGERYGVGNNNEISVEGSESDSNSESFSEDVEGDADGNEVVGERRPVPGDQMHKLDSLSERQKEIYGAFLGEAKKFFSGNADASRANLATIVLRRALEDASKKEGNDVDVMKMQRLFWDTAIETYGKDKVPADKLAFVEALAQGKSYETALNDMNKVVNQQAQEIPKRIDPNRIRMMDPNAGVAPEENHEVAQAEQNQNVPQEENILEENNDNVDEQPQPIQNNIRVIRQRVEEMQAPVNEEEQAGNPQVKSFKSNTVLAAYRSLLDQIPAQGAGDGGSLDSDLEKNFGGRNVNWLKQGQPLALSREEPRIPSAVKDYFMKDEENGLRAANCLGMLLKQDTLTQLEQDRRESSQPAGNELEFENQARDYRVKRTNTGAYEIEVLVEASVSKIKGGGANGQDLLLDPAQSKIKYSTKYVLTFGQDGKPQLDTVGETEVDFQKTEAQLSQTQMNTLRNFIDPDTNEELGKNAVWELSALNNDDFKKALDDLTKPEITANEEQLTATRKRVADFLRENTITERDKTLLRGLGLGRQEMERLIRGRIPGAHLTKAHLKNFYSEVLEERREALAQLKELQKKQEETKWIIHENLLEERIALTVEGGVKGSYDELFSDLRLTWDFLDDANVDDEKKTNIRNVITGLGDKNATDEVKKQHLDTLNQFLVDQRKMLGFNYLHAFQEDFSTRQIEILKEHFNSAQEPLKREIEENMQQLYDQKDDASVRNAIDKLQTSIQAYALQHGEVLVEPENPGQNDEEQHLQLDEQNQAAA